MDKLCLFVILAVLSSGAFGRSYRHVRQATEDPSKLEDRYGWQLSGNRFPPRRPNPNMFSNQDQFINVDSGEDYPGFDQFGQNQWFNQNQNQGQRPVTPPPAPAPTPAPTGNPSGSTQRSETLQACLRRCPVTPEYNPECGSDNVTYNNPSRLYCAQACGVNVSKLRQGRCPNSVTPN